MFYVQLRFLPVSITVLIAIVGLSENIAVLAAPLNHRMKRVSDTHFADLETRIALNRKVDGILITVPIGGGKVDPSRIGRKRRSQSRLLDALLNRPIEANEEVGEMESDERGDADYQLRHFLSPEGRPKKIRYGSVPEMRLFSNSRHYSH